VIRDPRFVRENLVTERTVVRGRPEKRQASAQRPAPTDADPGPLGPASARSGAPRSQLSVFEVMETRVGAPECGRFAAARAARSERLCGCGASRRGIRPGRSRGACVRLGIPNPRRTNRPLTAPATRLRLIHEEGRTGRCPRVLTDER
jgi:hypothetical protein